MNTRLLAIALISPLLALTVSCSTPLYDRSSPAAATAAPPMAPASYAVEYGVVRDIALVDTRSGSSGAGAVIGGVLGAVVGNQVGSGFGRAAATGAGAVGGALVGNAIEGRRAGAEQAYRVDVQTDRGDMRSFYYQDLNGVRVGDRVRIENNQLFRG
ncbi:MAG: glycine zipper 2TM domain-containing protein [Gammaproteobacteria bacterium]